MLCNGASGCKNTQGKSEPRVTNVTQSVLKNNVMQAGNRNILCICEAQTWEDATDILRIVLLKMSISGIRIQKSFRIIWTKP